MLAVRTLTAAILLAAFLAAVLYLERGYFALIAGAVVAFGAREWALLIRMRPPSAMIYACACTVLYGAIAAAAWPIRPATMPMLAILAVALVFWAVAVPAWLARGMHSSPQALLSAAGVAVLVPAGLAMVALPAWLMLAILGLVWISDTAAYFVGRAIGRHKLAPTVSPGKTIEGAVAAVVASVAYAAILAASMPAIGAHVKGLGWVPYVGAAMALCVVGILGDLFESLTKRHAGVKDSGKLLPGHGGVLDRIDSACAVLPVGALFGAWAGTT